MTRQFRSGCPIASTLDMVGDRWSLVILRDMLCGKTRFSQFLDSPERITPSVLTDRLTFLEADGLICRKLYSERPKRYEFFVTAKGEALLPVLQIWSCARAWHLGGTGEFHEKGDRKRSAREVTVRLTINESDPGVHQLEAADHAPPGTTSSSAACCWRRALRSWRRKPCDKKRSRVTRSTASW